MDQHKTPECSREPDISLQATNEPKSMSSNADIQLPALNLSTPQIPESFSLTSNFSYIGNDDSRHSNNLLALFRPSFQGFASISTTTTPNRLLQNIPQSLFLLALSKLNESPISLAIINHIKSTQSSLTAKISPAKKSIYISPPDSLTSAPPSYSFVLRQMAARRRPRLMGTFIPSPSFVQHTPPPTYATAFDIYVDNTIPPPPHRNYSLGFAPMPVVCPECGFTGMSITTTKVTLCTHMCAFILCLFFCWICVPLPYVLRSCKDVYHYCANCRNFLGMYCPTNPDRSYR